MSDFYAIDSSDGSAQQERFPEALKPGYFAIDELSVEQLLVLGKRLAENLKYYSFDNSETGTWDDLFAHDSAFVLADIASTDTARLELQYAECVAKQTIFERAAFVSRLAKKIDSWSRALCMSAKPTIAPLNAELNQIIRHTLTDRLIGINSILAVLGEDPAVTQHRFKDFSASWKLFDSNTDQIGSTPGNLPTGSLTDLPEQQRFLDTSFHRFLGAITYLKNFSDTRLDTDDSACDQNPAVSLYIAFLKLYSRAQETLNSFPAKRLEFYYSRILQAEPRARQPDAVNLALTLTPGQSPVRVPADTQFLAGKDSSDNDIVFASEEDLTLTTATVQTVRTVSFYSDPLISPEHELGCVTRIKAIDLAGTFVDGVSYPLFGPAASSTAAEAEMGLAIASPLLHLREGKRKITVDFDCQAHESLPEDSEQAAALLAQLKSVGNLNHTSTTSQSNAINQRRRFFQLLGRMFARELMSGSPWLTAGAKRLIRQAATKFFDSRSPADKSTLEVINNLLTQGRTALFYQLLRDSFDVRLTAEQGWLACGNYYIAPLPEQSEESAVGLRLEFSLTVDDPAVVAYDKEVHGGDFTTDEPIAQLRVNPNSMFFAYSLFATLNIEAVNLAVDVQGATALVAYSNLGQLDCSKPFIPFGPQPGRDSFFAIGHYEAASKPLTQAHLNIEWGDLPSDFAGFEEYYSGYTKAFSNDSFKVQTSILESNSWSGKKTQAQPLFTTVAQTGQVGRHCRLDLIQGRHYTALNNELPETDYHLDNRARSGFFRIDLGLRDDAFGHAEYPQLMTTTLMANVKRRKPLPLPRTPYTPLMNKISLDYSAKSSIRFRTEKATQVAQTGDMLFYQHPFGTVEQKQTGRETPVSLMPRFNNDGYLLLGLSSEHPLGVVNLLFDLRDGMQKSVDQIVHCSWYYLSANRFRPLPKTAILRDTTANFTTSGIITIDFPDDINLPSTIFRGDNCWLAIAAQGDLSLCPRLHAVRTNALTAVRRLSEDDTSVAPVASGTINEAVTAPIGVDLIKQQGDSFGGRPRENKNRLITRTAERLRHKNRACQQWDYEHLVLERFPDLYKVKCFANMSMDHNRPMPGEVLIVVVPRVVDADTAQTQQLRVDARRLEQIQRYLGIIAPQFATISVRNAVYEQVQVRCGVKLVQSSRHGKYIQDINQVISDFMSPWRSGGYGARFGWCIRKKDIEARIGALSYVEFVTDFSMLHITQESDQFFCLQDTARPADKHPEAPVAGSSEEIVPRYPWSLALPSRRHFIQTIPDIGERQAQATGVGELEVGNTLILDSGQHNG